MALGRLCKASVVETDIFEPETSTTVERNWIKSALQHGKIQLTYRHCGGKIRRLKVGDVLRAGSVAVGRRSQCPRFSVSATLETVDCGLEPGDLSGDEAVYVLKRKTLTAESCCGHLATSRRFNPRHTCCSKELGDEGGVVFAEPRH